MDIVAECGKSELDGLRAIRDKLAADLQIAEASYSAQVAARLESVLKRITELSPSGEETIEDALAARRREREANRTREPQGRRTKSGN